ncbi:hypothetical protein RSOLAG1IB_10267 [Rhizoctonia solani AG-1 IB]|uniref:ATP-dependent DNA helicase n=1 Tax=Thanatephorus cucumeris (strain AG1-IB / isolate 7/3/14) TaxID=1108050 RepID=M5C0Q1_THACB|nr:hypothetical protein BN14_07041 [Rhizoctonia solani AG-1 IB]CEL62185.1 hypothetical protein RSOLAG1IB_10267 [Rhizoctonia solani AG-1 IB]
MQEDSPHNGDKVVSSSSITPDMVIQASNKAENQWDVVHGQQAVEIARSIGFFKYIEPKVQFVVERASREDVENLAKWMKLLKEGLRLQHTVTQANNVDRGDVTLINSSRTDANIQQGDVVAAALHEVAIELINTKDLYPKQQRAFKLVQYHISQFIESCRQYNVTAPPQLMMLLVGEGGTGKLRVIQTITREFAHNDASHILLKSAYTGKLIQSFFRN